MADWFCFRCRPERLEIFIEFAIRCGSIVGFAEKICGFDSTCDDDPAQHSHTWV